MPGILCCFGAPPPEAQQPSKHKDVAQRPDEAAAAHVPVAASTKGDTAKEHDARLGQQGSLTHVPSPPLSPSTVIPTLVLGAGHVNGESVQGLAQGLDLQRRISRLQGHWWTRVEDALELIAKAYNAACASVWIMDEATESFVVLVSKGPMRQAVQPGYSLHLGSEYDANNPSSLTSLWDTKAAQSYSASAMTHTSNSSALHANRGGFPADWKLLYNAHHLTDFLAWPLIASTPSGPAPAGGACTSANSDSVASAVALTAAMASNGGVVLGNVGASTDNNTGALPGQHVVGALTLYLSRPGADPLSDPLPSVFTSAVEQELVSLAFSSALFCSGAEPVRQVCELVVAVQSAAGSGEVAAAVAAGMQARMHQLLSVSPTALLALVPPKQVSAVVFRDLTAAAAAEAAGGVDSMAVGQSSSQTLPLLHPALSSVAGGGASYSGSHSHGGGQGLRSQYKQAGIHLGGNAVGGATGATSVAADGSLGPGTIERSPSLLGTGLRGDAAAASGAGGTTASAAAGNSLADMAGGASRVYMHNSRSLGVFPGQNNPSGLFSCRLDRMPSRYKALVFPLSHTLLQVVLQQRQERKLKEAAGGAAGAGGGGAKAGAAGSGQGKSVLRDLCMSAAAAAAAAGGATGSGWIIGDCNEHLHAVHSPSRDVYVLTRVNARRPHSLVLATAELGLLGGAGGPNSGAVGGGASTGGGAGAGAVAGSITNTTHIAIYLAFPEKLPKALLESALADMQLLMRRLVAPLIRLRFEGTLAEEWAALATAANNLPSPGGPALRIAASVSASQARQTPPVPAQLLLSNAVAGGQEGGGESHSNTWLSRIGAPGTGHGGPGALSPLGGQYGGGGGGGVGSASMLGPPVASTSELHLEGLSAGEALQQMSVLVSSYMDTLQAMQGQLMASDRVAESLRREDLPHLQLLEVLGHGGGGVVFRGKLHALEVAVKVFEVPGDLATAAGLASLAAPGTGRKGEGGSEEKQAAWPAVGDRRVLQRSALELAVTASVSHPHIIQVYSLYTNMVLVKQKPPKHGTSGVQLLELSAATAMCRADEGIPCSALCMEYCDMGTLAHAIDQHRFMTVTPLGSRRPALKSICTTLLEVALALRHLHARNLAHCDLKPANVLLKSSRRDNRGFTCKLADFGYVSVLKASVPGGRPTILPEEACGTVTHMAPETFIKGQPLDFSVDTFSFGILMWELYTCARPYADVPEDQIAQRVTLKGLRPTFPADTPRAYAALARQCWSQDPNERPNASETVSAIENMLQIMSTQLPAIPPLKPKTPTSTTPGVPSPAPGGDKPAAAGAGVPASPPPAVAAADKAIPAAASPAAAMPAPAPAQSPLGKGQGGATSPRPGAPADVPRPH